MHGRVIAVWFVMTSVIAGTAARSQTKDWKHPCGSAIHIFSDSGIRPDSPLGSVPQALQSEIKSALQPLLAEEAKITGANEDGSDIDNLEKSLRIHLLGRSKGGKELYAAWWDIPMICGNYENCPIWLLEADSRKIKNLVKPGADNPVANTNSGWGIAVLPYKIPGDRVMIVQSAFVSGRGPAQAVPLCWRRDGDFYVSDPCPPSCKADLNRGDK